MISYVFYLCVFIFSSLHIPRPEREQTSDWCPVMRTLLKPSQEGKHKTGAECLLVLLPPAKGNGQQLVWQSWCFSISGVFPRASFGRLEPHEGKPSRTALGGRSYKAPALPGTHKRAIGIRR